MEFFQNNKEFDAVFQNSLRSVKQINKTSTKIEK